MNNSKKDADEELKVLDSVVPSYFVDAAIGSAWGRGLHRVLFGEIVVNPEIGSKIPAVRHTVNLIMTTDTVRELITYLQNLPGVSTDEG